MTHQGWQLQIVPFEGQYLFECFAPNLPDFMNDGEFYPDWDTAHAAACQFIEREISIQALIDLADDWLEAGLISEDEYWNLTSFD